VTEDPNAIPPEEKIDWSRRFIDPAIKMKWNSAIIVFPADSEHGKMEGTRQYPDGTPENFTVK